MINFDHLSPTQFEELCYDMLRCLGCCKINRRKGTGYDSSPSDGGRDIECSFDKEDPDGDRYITNRYVECKHHKSGVNKNDIYSGIVSADGGDGIHTLLVICSYSLSNPTKDRIESYIRNNKPKFRIKYWENKDIELLLQSKCFELISKYNLSLSL